MTGIAASGLEPLALHLPPVQRMPSMPAGFVAGGASVGIKASGRPDLALVVSTVGPVPAAAVFTPNPVGSAPVRWSKARLPRSPATGGHCGTAAAIVSTSGSANAATGADGDADQAAIAAGVASSLGVEVERVLCLSTGVIGVRLPVPTVLTGVEALVPSLSAAPGSLDAAARALMTTDTRVKVATTAVALADADRFAARSVRVTGIAKGVGMIHPRMATMLAVLLTDAAADPATLSSILRSATARTWDQLTVDRDTSTNDTVFMLASGASGAAPVEPGSADARLLLAAVSAVARDLARQQAADGEGATTLITCQVSGAVDDAEARAVAREVVASNLLKAAVHGRDPNWGRIAAAAGNARLADGAVLEAAGLSKAEAASRAGATVALDPDRLRISIAGHAVFDGVAGGPLPFDREAARAAMDAPEVILRLDLGLGAGTGEAFGCDLSEQYVVENSEYTT